MKRAVIIARNVGGAAAASARRFLRDTRGTFYMLTAVSLPLFIGAAGLGLDYSRAVTAREQLLAAAESVALATAKRSAINAALTAGDLQDFARDGLRQALGRGRDFDAEIIVDPVTASVSIRVRERVDTMFADLLSGDGVYVVDARGAAAFGRVNLEIAIALDNTGSIRQELPAVKQAAHALVAEVSAGGIGAGEVDESLRFSIVPFETMVRLGPEYRNAPWVDQTGVTPHHFDHIDEIEVEVDGEVETYRPTRWELFDRFANRDWYGCFQERTAPHDVLDTPPNPVDPATLFAPYFAPDERDRNSRNNYLSDSGGVCDDEIGGIRNNNERERARRTCKYGMPGDPLLTLPNERSDNRHLGPNFACRTTPLLPLTEDRVAIAQRIDDMFAIGQTGTDVGQGVMWAWRALSPQAPLTQGAPYDDRTVRKIMVVMTDGDNYLRHRIQRNNTSFGFPGDGHLSAASGRNVTDSSSRTRVREAMDDRARAICANAQAQNIEVFMVGFGVAEGGTGAQVLRDCASSEEHVFFPERDDDLIQVFRRIGESIRTLRLVF